jgi:hypothetical protein
VSAAKINRSVFREKIDVCCENHKKLTDSGQNEELYCGKAGVVYVEPMDFNELI